MAQHIYVVGLDPFNHRILRPIAKRKGYVIHPLLEVSEVKPRRRLSIESLLAKTETILREASGRIDAIVGYWDFPVTCLAPYLANQRKLPAASLESVLKCEHKYWCRLEQSRIITEHPRFCAFDPFDEQALKSIPFSYPFWIKPIKAFASQLGFRIHNAREFYDSVLKIQKGIVRFTDPFAFFLRQVPLPEEVQRIHGGFCLAEEILSGRQCTLEGYVWQGEVVVYGVVDSIREANRSTFARYEYPSRLPRAIQERMIRIAQTLMTHLGYDNAPFNMEMYYDESRDAIWVLEINPRISQSHCDLFLKVDGASHHEVLIDLALGNNPDFPRRQGTFRCAAKFFIRSHHDGVVTHAPTQHDIERLQKAFPGTLVNIHVKPGMRLSNLLNQESYSYELGYIFMGAGNRQELLEHHREALTYLPFRVTK